MKVALVSGVTACCLIAMGMLVLRAAEATLEPGRALSLDELARTSGQAEDDCCQGVIPDNTTCTKQDVNCGLPCVSQSWCAAAKEYSGNVIDYCDTSGGTDTCTGVASMQCVRSMDCTRSVSGGWHCENQNPLFWCAPTQGPACAVCGAGTWGSWTIKTDYECS